MSQRRKGDAVAKQKELEGGLISQLKEAIRGSGQSLNQLSRKCGVGPDRLSRFLRGERSLNLDAAEKICHALRLRLVSEPTPRQQPEKPRKPKGPAQ